jgi:hypothetical protein
MNRASYKRKSFNHDWRLILPWLLIVLLVLTGCVQNRGEAGPKRAPFKMDSLIKADIDTVAEIHVETMREMLEEMTIKLYKRNPRELKKAGLTLEEGVRRLFARTTDWRFEELRGLTKADAIYLVFDDSFKGDRVHAFMTGLTSMVMASYDYRTEFFMLDALDPQKLYNSARNLEIAVWKVNNTYDANCELYLLMDSRDGETRNLSYERMFGKMIATQDNLAVVIADRQNRMIRKTIQRMATAVFLPI